MIYAGIDAGSRAIKVVLIDANGSGIVAKAQADQGIEQDKLACRLFEKTLAECGVGRSDVRRVVATGYGRNAIHVADTTITEITCHAVGVRHLVPEARTNHRHRWPGQQARSPGRQRQGVRLRHE